MAKRITPKEEDYSLWYNDIVKEAGLAEHSAVKGCMVIKPHGYAVWEKIQSELDRKFKETGHVNAYFPLFVPKSLFEAEEKNAEGFAKECAVVTHYRLTNDPDKEGKLMVDPEAKLEEELVVRPTSEAIIWNTYRNWIQSYRDLPLLINQWANVVRWEMRTRLFLRTAEFLWQEGHTAHASKEEAIEEAETMLEVYADFAEQYLALPVIKGLKSENERFAGAVETYCIEAMMQDGKALQAGTSHFLGQNFAEAFNVKFTNNQGKEDFVWATSWGVSTRLIGALIMAHSDNEGLVLPPKVAPIQVAIVPIYKSAEQREAIAVQADVIVKALRSKGVRVHFDNRDTHKPGWKFAEYELKGVPLRVAIGPKDLEKGTAEVARRDTKEKQQLAFEGLPDELASMLDQIQAAIFERASRFRDANTYKAETWDEFKRIIEETPGFIYANWDGSNETEEAIKQETKATIRCIPLEGGAPDGACIYSGKPGKHKVIFAKAY